MIINESTLRRIIREEASRVLREAPTSFVGNTDSPAISGARRPAQSPSLTTRSASGTSQAYGDATVAMGTAPNNNAAAAPSASPGAPAAPSTTPVPVNSPSVEGTPKLYKVKYGDSISVIVKTFYGIFPSPNYSKFYTQIATASGIANPDVISSKDTLQLPATLGGTGSGAIKIKAGIV